MTTTATLVLNEKGWKETYYYFILHEYVADFVVLDDSGHDDNPQHHHFCLLVKELPDHITESELREFFQDRRQSGGGPVAKVDFNPAKRSAAIFFVNSEGMVQWYLS